MGSDLGGGALCRSRYHPWGLSHSVPSNRATSPSPTGHLGDTAQSPHHRHLHLHPQPRGLAIRGSHHFSPESLQQGPSFSAHFLHSLPIHFPHSCCAALSKHRPSRAILHFKTTRWLLITCVVQSGPPVPYTLALTNSSEMVPLFAGLLVLSLPHAFPLWPDFFLLSWCFLPCPSRFTSFMKAPGLC